MRLHYAGLMPAFSLFELYLFEVFEIFADHIYRCDSCVRIFYRVIFSEEKTFIEPL